MKYSLGFKLLLIVLLPATLFWKLTVEPDDTQPLRDGLVNFLDRHGFAVELTDRSMEEMPVLRASSGQCQMSIMKVSALGWDWDMIRSLAAPGESAFSVFRGEIHRDQPVLQTSTIFAWSKFLHRIGLSDHVAPVVAIIAPASCNAERLPWEDLYAQGVL